MKKEDVPQDPGFSDGIPEISYAVDECGRYELVSSRGWEPKTVANEQAWEVIDEQTREQIRLIEAGRRSPLAYHMTRNLMDVGLLASYAGLSRWRVRRHLKPKAFNKLPAEIKARYAKIFGISMAGLHEVPKATDSDPDE